MGYRKRNICVSKLRKNYVRSCVRLTLGSYEIKPCKWDQKVT